MPKYFFEVSDLRIHLQRNNTLSGIQRVTQKVIFHAVQELGRDNVRLLFFDRRRKHHKVISANPLLSDEYLTVSQLKSALRVSNERFDPINEIAALGKYSSRPLKYRYHLLQFILAEKRVDRSFFFRRGTTLEEWQRLRSPKNYTNQINYSGFSHDSKEVLKDCLQQNDVICIMDTIDFSHGTNVVLPQVAKKFGAKIYTMIHDLIPLVAVEESGCAPASFHAWFSSVIDFSEGLIANSRHTSEVLAKYLEENAIDIPVHVAPLAQSGLSGANPNQPRQIVSEPMPTPGANIDQITKVFSKRNDTRTAAKLPFALCVGTIEGRKNCWRIAQAWSQLSMRFTHEMPRLVFAGKYGGQSDDFHQAYYSTGGWGGWVRVIESPSDDELDFFYRRCVFTITVSLYEGWGLTIGESLSYGKTAVVSDLTAMPEVGGDLVEYCNPRSISSIADAVMRLVSEPERRQELEGRISRAKLRQWSDVGRDIASVLSHQGT